MLTREEISRALMQKQGDITKAFRDAHITICGLGGLGSNVAMMLARSGIEHMKLIDSDIVDINNLHRQAYKASQIGMPKTAALKANILEVAPFAELELHMARINEASMPDLLQDTEMETDIVVECLDGPEDKAMLCNYVLENTRAYLVAASGMAGDASPNGIRTRKITDRFYLCGDEETDIEGSVLLGPRVMACAAHEAMAVLQILADRNKG
ncbi:MAG: sulfur carrier protein ThiS adenylyltransferase ThiF [Clostridia bacterium]|nr:sulfur carrier protein ThiS adenylyltransferase ThiF [Clostridia bacterium]